MPPGTATDAVDRFIGAAHLDQTVNQILVEVWNVPVQIVTVLGGFVGESADIGEAQFAIVQVTQGDSTTFGTKVASNIKSFHDDYRQALIMPPAPRGRLRNGSRTNPLSSVDSAISRFPGDVRGLLALRLCQNSTQMCTG